MAFAAIGQVSEEEYELIGSGESPPEKGETYMTIIDGQYGFHKDDSTFALGVYDKISRFSVEGYLVKIEDKCGITDNEGNLIIPVEYDFIYKRVTGYITVKKDGKEGLYNYQGEIIFPCQYDKIKMSAKKEITVINEGKMGLYNKSGREILPVKYDLIERFPTSGLGGIHYLVKENGHVGIVTSRATIVPLLFDEISEDNELFIVTLGELSGLYSIDGKELLTTTYVRIYHTVNKRSKIAIAEKDGHLGIVDNQGKRHLMGELKDIRYIQNSMNLNSPYTPNKYELYLGVQGKNGKWGIFDEYNCALKVPIIYDSIVQKMDLNRATYFIVQQGDKMGVINSRNHILVPFNYDHLNFNFMRAKNTESEADIQIVAKKKNNFGLIDLEETILIPFEYNCLFRISFDGLYRAKKKSGYSIINHKNEVLVQGPFDHIGDYDNGIALTFKDGEMRAIDESGNFLTEAKAMTYHRGFRTFEKLKTELIACLNSEDDSELMDFATKITPSKHILYLFSKISHTYAYVEYLSPSTISKRYSEILLEIKRKWNDSKYDHNKLISVEDYTIFEGRVYTNQRNEVTTFGMRELEWILKDAIRMDGFWVSTFFLKHSFK